MSRAVVRLLKDVHPLWALTPLLIIGTLSLLDSVQLFQPSSRMPMMGFGLVLWPFIPSGPYFGKFAMWRVLPVSRLEVRRAQWWAALGLPLVWVTVSMAIALMVVAITSGAHANALDVAAALGRQLLAVTVAVAVYSVGAVLNAALRRRQTLRAAPPWLTVALACAMFAATFLPSPGPLAQAFAGAVALALALLAYASPNRIDDLVQSARRGVVAPVAPRAEVRMGQARGWAAMMPVVFGALAFSALVAGAATYFSPIVMRHGASAGGAGAGGAQLMLVLVVWAIGGATIARAVRPLRLLPLGSATLTAIFQGFILIVAAAAFAAVWAVQALVGADSSQLYLFVTTSIPVLALNPPLNFRFGGRRVVWPVFVPIVLVTLARLIPSSTGPAIAAGSIAITAGLWVWTWWEISRGRGAYRAHPAIPRWRGLPA